MQIGRRGVDIFRPHPPSSGAAAGRRQDCSAIFRSRRRGSPPAPLHEEGEEDDAIVSSLPGPSPPVWPPAEIAGCLSDSTAGASATSRGRGRRARILGRGRSLRSSCSGSASPPNRGGSAPGRPSYYRIELDGASESARLEYLEDSSVVVPPGGDRSDLLRVATPRRMGSGAPLSRASPVGRSASGERPGSGEGGGFGHVWTVNGTGKIVALPVPEVEEDAVDGPSAVPQPEPIKGGAPEPSSPVPLLCKASMSDDDDDSFALSRDGDAATTPAGATPAVSSSSSIGDEYDIVSPPRLGRSAGLLAFPAGAAASSAFLSGERADEENRPSGSPPSAGMQTAIQGEIRDRIAGGARAGNNAADVSSGASAESSSDNKGGGCEGGIIAAILEVFAWNACCQYSKQGGDGAHGHGMAGVCQS